MFDCTFTGFSSHRITSMTQFFSSVCACVCVRVALRASFVHPNCELCHLTPPCLGLSLTFAFFECQQILKGLQHKVTSSCVAAYYIRFLLHKVPGYHFNKANPKGIYRAPGCPQFRFFVCFALCIVGVTFAAVGRPAKRIRETKTSDMSTSAIFLL